MLVLVGVVLLLVAFGGAWATAPDPTGGGTGDDGSEGVMVGVQGPAKGGSVVALDGDASTRWQYDDGTGGTPISYQNVERLPDGTVLTSFADDDYEDCGAFESPCVHTGYRVLDVAGDPEQIEEWSYPVRTRKDSEVHDVERLPDGDVLIADMEYEGILEVDRESGEHTWIWNASEYYDPPADPTREDWLHLNDVDRVAEGLYLVSIRNTNQLLFVDRDDGVVEVVNEDRDRDVLYEQHNPHYLGEGRILVADSENDRVVELHRTDDGEWEPRWSVSSGGGMAFNWPRDADRLPNGDTVITDSRNNRVVVVDEDGELRYGYGTPALPYEADVLPHGEEPDVAADEPPRNESVPSPGSSGTPLLTPIHDALTHFVPVPYWITEVHVLVAFVVAGLWLRGGWLVVRRLRRE